MHVQIKIICIALKKKFSIFCDINIKARKKNVFYTNITNIKI